jgi:hypothetical protein
VTHAEKVLRLLSDGKPHTHMEGYRLGVMLHSRVADLRAKGYRIDCWREGDNYLYQLGAVLAGDDPETTGRVSTVVPLPGPPQRFAPQDPQILGVTPGPTALSPDKAGRSAPPQQLLIWEAAA